MLLRTTSEFRCLVGCLICPLTLRSIEATNPSKFYVFSDSAVDLIDGDEEMNHS